jgi:radical SAM superfamily enzyme YgiQ (UPF0313 family)
VAPSANPRPISIFTDAVHIGDCERHLPCYLESIEKHIRELRGPAFIEARDALLEEWAQSGSAYIPGCADDEGEPPAWDVYDGFADDPGYSIVVTTDSIWGDSFLVETSRGCDVGCSFCLISYNKGKCRNASFDALKRLLEANAPGAGGVGLIGSAVGSYPHLLDAVRLCVEMGKRVGLSSLNFRNAPDELLGLLAASGEHKVTMAVETASDRLQRDIGKAIPDELVIDRVRAAFESGMKSVKLYFIVGLPGEGQSDLDDSIELIKRIAQEVDLRSRGGSAELDIGISCFVPKAATPWEKKSMASAAQLKNRIDAIRAALSDIPYLDVTAESPELSIFQGILSTGDDSTSEIISSSAQAGPNWRAAFRKSARASGWLGRILSERA